MAEGTSGGAGPLRPGSVGVSLRPLAFLPHADAVALARRAESAGIDAVWFPESVPGKEAFSLAGALLAATERLVVATGIANAWARDPVAMENGARTLAEAYPGRFVLGIGVSHPETVRQRGHEYRGPAAFIRDYLARMDAAAEAYDAAQPSEPAPRILAAMGPRMIELAATGADGAFPAPVTAAFTSRVREAIGGGKVVVGKQLAPGLDAAAARKAFAGSLGWYGGLDIYRRHFARLGWSAEDLDGGGSDALIDEIVTAGDRATIAGGIAAQFDAGADHVVAVLSGVDPEPDGLRLLGEAVSELRTA